MGEIIVMNKKQLKDKYGEEKIFVVPYSKLEFIPDGFTPLKHDVRIWSQFDSMGEYIYRYDAEGQPYMQQIIPYILILDESNEKIFTTKRIAGDSRLVDKVSIACGGHIDGCDEGKEVLFKAAVRELFEEVNADIMKPLEIIGYVRDLSSSTSDHTGVVVIAHATGEVTVKENENLIGQWMNLGDLISNYEKLEGWSKHIVDYFTVKKKIY